MKFYIKIIGLVLGLILISIGLNLINQKREVFAENEILKCGTKIPIGETMDDTSDLLNDVYVEMKNIYNIMPMQINAAEEMIKAARECSLGNCQPVCVDISCYSSSLGDKDSLCEPLCRAKCIEKECKGKICPDLGFINDLINSHFEKIDDSFEKINDLYAENIEEINKELEESRIGFNACSNSETSETIRCKDIFDKGYKFPNEKIKECQEICGENKKAGEIDPACLECLCVSSANYFCCD
jgi:hypothetical protein